MTADSKQKFARYQSSTLISLLCTSIYFNQAFFNADLDRSLFLQALKKLDAARSLRKDRESTIIPGQDSVVPRWQWEEVGVKFQRLFSTVWANTYGVSCIVTEFS